jgi:hypothetical protein
MPDGGRGGEAASSPQPSPEILWNVGTTRGFGRHAIAALTRPNFLLFAADCGLRAGYTNQPHGTKRSSRAVEGKTSSPALALAITPPCPRWMLSDSGGRHDWVPETTASLPRDCSSPQQRRQVGLSANKISRVNMQCSIHGVVFYRDLRLYPNAQQMWPIMAIPPGIRCSAAHDPRHNRSAAPVLGRGRDASRCCWAALANPRTRVVPSRKRRSEERETRSEARFGSRRNGRFQVASGALHSRLQHAS